MRRFKWIEWNFSKIGNHGRSTNEDAMSSEERPPKPHPQSLWDEEAQVWIWPDECDELGKASDELAAELAESSEWEKHGFRRKHSARIDRP